MQNVRQMLWDLVFAELGEKKTNAFTTDSLPAENEFSLAKLLRPRESHLSAVSISFFCPSSLLKQPQMSPTSEKL